MKKLEKIRKQIGEKRFAASKFEAATRQLFDQDHNRR